MTLDALISYRARVRGIAITAVLALGGCSLQGLDDLTPPFTPCTGPAECEPLNLRDGIAEETCERWVCVTDYCRLRRPGTSDEICNGADDDCDTRIDEAGEVVEPIAVLDFPAPLQSIESRAGGGATAVFLTSRSATFARATVLDAEPVSPTAGSFATSDDGVRPPLSGCVGSDPARTCSLDRMSLSHLEGDLHVVASRVARPDGPLRIGPIVDREVTLSGTDARSSIWRGLDAGSDGAIEDLTVVGASFDRDRTPSALVAATLPDAIGGARVGLLGVWLERDPSDLRWAHGTNDGDLQRAAAPLAGDSSAPDIAALADGRWLVAYPTAPAGVAWVLVGALAEPAPRCMPMPTRACVTSDERGLVTQVPMAATDARTSDPLVVEGEGVLASVMPDELVVATGRAVEGAGQSVALAYLEDEDVVFVPGSASSGIAWGEARRVAAAGAHDLSITYVESGLTTGEVRGGYVLAWSTSDGTYVARLADAPSEPIVSFLGAPTTHPRAFLDETGGVSLVAGSGASLVVLAHACGVDR